MQLLRGLYDLQPLVRDCVAIVGNFDGVHLGHQAILAHLREYSLELDVPSCMAIFEPQSRELFSPDPAPVRLTRLRERLESLRGQDVDVVLYLTFNRHLRELSATEFVRQVLVDELAVRHLEVDDDFRFGCDRSDDFTFLVNTSREQGFTIETTATVELGGARVSNTRVCQALAEGDLHPAKRLLGRPFNLSERVLYGQRLDRQLGSPTANIQLKRHKTSLNGIYLVSTLIDSQRCQGVANIGTHPSVNGDGRPHLEMYLLDFAGDLYGRHLQATFHQKLCDEQRFASLEALKTTILVDIIAARACWLGQPLS